MVKNSKILVAGGTGFIGSNLILELISKNNEVISLSINTLSKYENVGIVTLPSNETIPIDMLDNKNGILIICIRNK